MKYLFNFFLLLSLYTIANAADPLELTEKAAKGDPEAQYNLAKFYLDPGSFVDKENGVYWLLKSAEQGLLKSQALLIEVFDGYTNADNEEELKEKACKWASIADVNSTYNPKNATDKLLMSQVKFFIGRSYGSGLCGQIDISKAESYLIESSKLGNVYADAELSDIKKEFAGSNISTRVGIVKILKRKYGNTSFGQKLIFNDKEIIQPGGPIDFKKLYEFSNSDVLLFSTSAGGNRAESNCLFLTVYPDKKYTFKEVSDCGIESSSVNKSKITVTSPHSPSKTKIVTYENGIVKSTLINNKYRKEISSEIKAIFYDNYINSFDYQLVDISKFDEISKGYIQSYSNDPDVNIKKILNYAVQQPNQENLLIGIALIRLCFENSA